jgi:hypothetical protein
MFRKDRQVVANATCALIAVDLGKCRIEPFSSVEEAKARANHLADNEDAEMVVVVPVQYVVKRERA